VFTLPEIGGLSSTYFVSLVLEDPSGHPVSRNFYWLSTKLETLDWDKSHLVLHAHPDVRRLHRPQ